MNLKFKFQEPNILERNLAVALSFLFCCTIYLMNQLLKHVLISVFNAEITVQQNETIDIVPSEVISSTQLKKRNDNISVVNGQSSTASLLPVQPSSDSTPSSNKPTNLFLSSLHIALQDGVCTFAVCVCSLENGLVRACLGCRAVLFSICLHGIVNMQLAWKDSYGSPCNAFYRYIDGRRTTFCWILVSWMCQLLGAFAALKTSFAWWELRATSYHSNLLDEKLVILHHVSKNPEMEGVGDLNVALSTGMLIEGGAAFVDVFLAILLTAVIVAWRRKRKGRDEQEFLLEGIAFTIRQGTNLYLIAQGIQLTGVYVNPANAVIQTWGLGNAQPMSHLLVYWFSPMLGIFTAYHLARRLISINSPLYSPLAPSYSSPPGSLVLEEHVGICRPHSTQANVQTESHPQLLFANVDPVKKTVRCRSQTRAQKSSTGLVWRRSSECRFLPDSFNDYVCRRCPVINSIDNSVILTTPGHHDLDDGRSLI